RRDEVPNLDVPVVQRNRRDADDVRFAPVANEAASGEGVEDGARLIRRSMEPQRQLTAARLRIGGSDDRQVAAGPLPQQRLPVAGEPYGLAAQDGQRRPVEQFE